MGDLAVNCPTAIARSHCANDAEVKQTLEDYRRQNPGTSFTNVMVHEMRSTSTTGPSASRTTPCSKQRAPRLVGPMLLPHVEGVRAMAAHSVSLQVAHAITIGSVDITQIGAASCGSQPSSWRACSRSQNRRGLPDTP